MQSLKQLLLEAEKTTTGRGSKGFEYDPDQFMTQQMKQAEKEKPGSSAALYPAEPKTMSRKQSVAQTDKYSQWLPGNPNSEFVKILSKTKDLGQTLNTAYDTLSKQYGEKDALHIMSNSLMPATGKKDLTKQDLLNPAIQKKLGSYLSQQYPSIKKVIPNLPSE